MVGAAGAGLPTAPEGVVRPLEAAEAAIRAVEEGAGDTTAVASIAVGEVSAGAIEVDEEEVASAVPESRAGKWAPCSPRVPVVDAEITSSAYSLPTSPPT